MLKMICGVLALALVLLPATVSGAPEGESKSEFRTWFMYFGDHSFGAGPIGFHFDGQARVEDLGTENRQLLLRPGINIDLSPSVQISGGYAYVRTSTSSFVVPENRLWEQLVLKQTIGRVDLVHRYRIEQRFIGPRRPEGAKDSEEELQSTYLNRFRYFLKGRIPLRAAGDSRLFLALYNELMINFGTNVDGNFFDQNRSYAAIGFTLGRFGSLETGYLLQLARAARGDSLAFNHTLQIALSSTLPIGR